MNSFIKLLGNKPKIRILDFLIENFAQDYSLTQIAKESKVAYTSLIDLLPELLKQELIFETRKIGKSRLYKTNIDNKMIKVLIKLDQEINSF